MRLLSRLGIICRDAGYADVPRFSPFGHWPRALALATALSSIPLAGCGEIFGEIAEQRHVQKATRDYVYEATPDAIWTGARAVLSEKGFALPDGTHVAGKTVKAIGTEQPRRREWVEARLAKVGSGHRLELMRIIENEVEDVHWEGRKVSEDKERLAGVEKRLGSNAKRDGEALVLNGPRYRVWADVRQELLDAGISVPNSDPPSGALETPWIDGGDQRSRRRVSLETLADSKFRVQIDIERETKRVEKRWDRENSKRDANLELLVIERVEPEKAAQIRADAQAKSQSASKIGDKVDAAVGEAVEEAVKQEQQGVKQP